MILYHYSNAKFDKFDTSKSDGIWLTTIAPNETELLNEIGAAGTQYVAKVVVDIEDLEALTNGDNYDVADQLSGSGYDYIKNIYDGFEDYAFLNQDNFKSMDWSKL